MTRTGDAAAEWARRQVDHPVKDFTRLCLQFVRMAFDLPAVYPDAGQAWDHAKFRHPTTDSSRIPRAVPVHFELPSVADHVAFSLGGGLCLSNDIRRSGRIDVVRIDTIRTAWGAQLHGWTEDLNGFTIWRRTPAAPPAPPAPVETNVSRARGHLHIARRHLAIADRYLEQVPAEREHATRVARQIDDLADELTAVIKRTPKK